MKLMCCGLGVMATVLLAPAQVLAKSEKSVTVNCGLPQQSVQAAIDDATPGVGTTIFISGECSEDITIAKDAITLNGDPNGLGIRGGEGTIDGEITVSGADNVSIEFLTVTGAGGGIGVTDGADVDIIQSRIDANDSFGVALEHASVVRLAATDITDNQQFGGLLLNRNAVVEMLCDSQIAGNIGDEVHLEEGSTLRQQRCTAPAANDVIDGTTFVFNGSTMDIRGASVTGDIDVYGTATFRVQHSSIVGDVRARGNSLVGFRPNASFEGSLICDASSGIFGTFLGLGNVQCGQTCSGAVPGTCAP